MKIFLASPLGFAESTRGFISHITDTLTLVGHTVIDPWSSSDDIEIELRKAQTLPDEESRKARLHQISLEIAARNAELLVSCDSILAVLDGVDVDSGTASEIGYAFGLGSKTIYGLRTDFRQSGENIGVLVNLQVQYWIEKSGGKIFTSLEDLKTIHVK